jgi:cell wall-associated NlpC family hydrolase
MNEKKFFRASLFGAIFLATVLQIHAAEKLSETRQKLITYALQFQGTKYVYGGRSPDEGFDCSGFVTYVTNHAAGIQLPRQSGAIYNYSRVKKISEDEREPGDLMFFKNDMNSDRITHVGIYCGVYSGPIKEFEGKRVFISAVSDGKKTGVQLSCIDERFWKNHFFAYGRFLPASDEK